MKEGEGGEDGYGEKSGCNSGPKGGGVEGLRSGRWGSDSGYKRGLEDDLWMGRGGE